MSEHRYLPDTRPYPAEPVKRELLMHAEQAARGGAQGKLAAEALRAQIYGMLSQNFYLNLSVALSMTPSEAAYGTMMAALNDVLQAKTDEEIQWFALPVILVAGCKQAAALTAAAPAPSPAPPGCRNCSPPDKSPKSTPDNGSKPNKTPKPPQNSPPRCRKTTACRWSKANPSARPSHWATAAAN